VKTPACWRFFFLGSGLLHELAIPLSVRSGGGKIPALLAVILPVGLLFPPAFQVEVIARCLGVFDLSRGWLP
jgi:hypothetical protein